MRIPVKTLKNSVRWLRSRFVGKALILGYHRVAEVSSDVYGMCLSPQHFEEQLHAISRIAQPVSLSALIKGLESDTVPKRAVAITFDDGYADNLNHARSSLERYRIPATFFVTTGALGNEFWWDELERLILSLPIPHQVLSLELDGESFEWRLGGISNDPQQLLERLYQCLRGLTPVARTHALHQLQIWRGTAPRASGRALTAAELGELASSAWVEIGSHTVTHPILTYLPISDQRAEIQQSKADLEALIHRPVTGFSYPNGALTAQTQTLVRDAGYAYACTSENDVVSKNSSSFALPRFWPPNWDGARFSEWLKRWL